MAKKQLSEKRMTGEIFLGQVFSVFIDSFIVMLCLGGLAHQLHRPVLALSYWSCVLLQIIALAILPNTIGISVKLEYVARMMLRGGRP